MTKLSVERANIQTFERIEKKFLLDDAAYTRLRQRIEAYVVSDAFGLSDIRSVYLDTPNYYVARFAMDKPVYKEKVRIRSYGAVDPNSHVFLELKKKFKGIVYKRRVQLPLKECQEFIASRAFPASLSCEHDIQIMGEIAQTCAHYDLLGGLQPVMFISSHRRSLLGADDDQLRLTFDADVLWRTNNVDIASGEGGNPLLQEGQHLLEVKAVGAMPLWLADALCECNAHPTPFSKYGRSYLAMLHPESRVA